jgi:hypothetical protein
MNRKKICVRTWRMAKALLLMFIPLTAGAQTSTSFYQPGVTAEGAVYFLPKTAVRVTVQIEKSTYTPGEFCKYADRYLRLRNVSMTPSVTYRITGIRQEAAAVADSSKCFAVKFNPKSVAANIALSDDGVLLAINAAPTPLPLQQKFVPSPRPEQVNPRQLMSEEILAAGSTAKMAELTAREIYDIRESRNLLVRGQADNMPKDGEQLNLMLSHLQQQDKLLTGLFAGTTVRDTTERAFTVVPDADMDKELVFRFSKRLGLVDKDDLAGEPYYIKVVDLHSAPMPDGDLKRKKQEDGIYVNVPGRMRTTVFNAAETLVETELPAAQFGNVELLSGALFNKHYATHLWLNPATGAIERLEAEEPK